jgi:type IV pilus assembly protein PilA
MKKFLKNPLGFTLVELMVVVAIIGILSAIAVPNFKKYQAKAKQSEAKISLSGIYTAEAGALADYDTYASCIQSLGVEIPAAGYYISGFNADFAGGATTGGSTQVTTRGGVCVTTVFTITPVTRKQVSGTAPTTIINAAYIPALTTFVAGSSANISAALIDTWQINEAKTLSNPIQGY